MHNLSMVITCLIVTHHGSYTLWHGACARVHPYNTDKSKWSSSGSRHAPCTSPHQALSAFIFLRKDQRQGSKRDYKLCFPLE